MPFTRLIKSCLLMLTINTAFAKDQLDWQPYTLEHKSASGVVSTDAQLSYIEVPEDHQNPNSKKLQIAIVKLPTTAAKPSEPIVYLAGGPGGSATGAAAGPRYDLFMKLRENSDVILFDQRGTGLSRNGLKNCHYPSALALSQNYTRESLLADIEASSRYCQAQWKSQGVNLNSYTTMQSVADLEAVRAALKVKKLNLWGISYGTHLALAMAKYHPQSIAKMVLASSEGLDQTIKLPALSDAHLQRVADDIAKDLITAKRYPDLPGLMKQVLAKLKAQPQLVDVQDPRSGKIAKIAVGDIEVQLLTAFMLTKDPEQIAMLPALFTMINAGNFSKVGPYLAYLRQSMWQLNPMAIAMDAASGISTARWQLVEQQSQSALLWRAHNLPFPDANRYLSINDLGDKFRADFNSTIPTVFLAGTLDGRTFIESQRQVASHFANATFVTVVGAGHNLLMSSPKITDIMQALFSGQRLDNQTITLPPIKYL